MQRWNRDVTLFTFTIRTTLAEHHHYVPHYISSDLPESGHINQSAKCNNYYICKSNLTYKCGLNGQHDKPLPSAVTHIAGDRQTYEQMHRQREARQHHVEPTLLQRELYNRVHDLFVYTFYANADRHTNSTVKCTLVNTCWINNNQYCRNDIFNAPCTPICHTHHLSAATIFSIWSPDQSKIYPRMLRVLCPLCSFIHAIMCLVGLVSSWIFIQFHPCHNVLGRFSIFMNIYTVLKWCVSRRDK